MPPVLDPAKSKIDGLAFVGLSLARKSEYGHPDSRTHQTSFDFNEIIDREYNFLFSTNDDGWLVGGGEPGPPKSYKLASPDSGHVEIMRIGTYKTLWGGLPQSEIVEILAAGHILIPQMEVCPTEIITNKDSPPELEMRFDMILNPAEPDDLPFNWQLRFVHNQLFKKFEFPSRFCPGAFHSTIVRKVEFRSERHRKVYFSKCSASVEAWVLRGPRPLIPASDEDKSNNTDRDIKVCFTKAPDIPNLTAVDTATFQKKQQKYQSGIYLFTDRKTVTHRFLPNFFPPYNTPDKQAIIKAVLCEDWDEVNRRWVKLDQPMQQAGDSTSCSALEGFGNWTGIMDCSGSEKA
jgi:hypothetical protein